MATFDIPNDGLRCSGLLPGNICAHGFRAGVACWPLTLEQLEWHIPMCCDEERCGELFNEMGGKPFQTPRE